MAMDASVQLEHVYIHDYINTFSMHAYMNKYM